MPITTYSTEAIILKRVNLAETDRVVTLLTASQGKVVAVAKGVRQMKSSQRAFLEPGNLVKISLTKTHSSLPILHQTQLISDLAVAKQSLKGIKQLTEVLEILDRLFPEGEEDVLLFGQVKQILVALAQPTPHFNRIQAQLTQMMISLGYQDFRQTQYSSILEFVSAVADRPMRSYEYLTLSLEPVQRDSENQSEKSHSAARLSSSVK